MTYMHGERSKAAIIQAGLALWRENGPSAVTARGIGKKVGLSHAGVIYHFGGVGALLEAVKREAIATGDQQIIPHLIVANDPLVAGWTTEQRQAWLSAAAG